MTKGPPKYVFWLLQSCFLELFKVPVATEENVKVTIQWIYITVELHAIMLQKFYGFLSSKIIKNVGVGDISKQEYSHAIGANDFNSKLKFL